MPPRFVVATGDPRSAVNSWVAADSLEAVGQLRKAQLASLCLPIRGGLVQGWASTEFRQRHGWKMAARNWGGLEAGIDWQSKC